jgi:hypothetical protein
VHQRSSHAPAGAGDHEPHIGIGFGHRLVSGRRGV